MDLLEKHKKAWKNQSEEKNKRSSIEIYKLAHSKSSSIVKWIFIIAMIEFIGGVSLSFFIDIDELYPEYKKIGFEKFIFYALIVVYPVLFYFLFMFYLNYKRISTTDSTRTLMKKIIKTRKTVRNYVWFNLCYFALVMLLVSIIMIHTTLINLNNKEIIFMLMITLILILFSLGLIWCFYQLLYGILLKKLNRNYKELSKLDTKN